MLCHILLQIENTCTRMYVCRCRCISIVYRWQHVICCRPERDPSRRFSQLFIISCIHLSYNWPPFIFALTFIPMRCFLAFCQEEISSEHQPEAATLNGKGACFELITNYIIYRSSSQLHCWQWCYAIKSHLPMHSTVSPSVGLASNLSFALLLLLLIVGYS